MKARRPRGEWHDIGVATRAVLCRAARATHPSPTAAHPDRVMPDLSPFDWRVLAAVIAYTATWTRYEDTLALARVAQFVGIWPDDGTEEQRAEAARRVGKSLKRLTALGLVEYEPARGRWSGRVGLPRPTQGWTDPTNGELVEPDRQVGGVRPVEVVGPDQPSDVVPTSSRGVRARAADRNGDNGGDPMGKRRLIEWDERAEAAQHLARNRGATDPELYDEDELLHEVRQFGDEPALADLALARFREVRERQS